MPDSTTINYSWSYPTVNADADTWGTTLNNTIIAIDAQLFANAGAGLQKSADLSDLANPGTARTNLGLGSAATSASSAFVAAGAACLAANNLADLGNPGTARANLGLGTGATVNITVSGSGPSGGNNGDIWIT